METLYYTYIPILFRVAVLQNIIHIFTGIDEIMLKFLLSPMLACSVYSFSTLNNNKKVNSA